MVSDTVSPDASPDSGEHSDDIAVDRFAAKMKAKLARAREKGRGGWDDPEQCSPDVLSRMLHDHVAKGDPIDVANFAMMIEHYGASIGRPLPSPRLSGDDTLDRHTFTHPALVPATRNGIVGGRK